MTHTQTRALLPRLSRHSCLPTTQIHFGVPFVTLTFNTDSGLRGTYVLAFGRWNVETHTLTRCSPATSRSRTLLLTNTVR